MNQNISDVLATLLAEKKSVTAEIAKLEKQRLRLLDTEKRIGRAINALSPKSESKSTEMQVSRDAVRKMVLEVRKESGEISEQALKQRLTEKLKSEGKSRNGLTKHLRAIVSETASVSKEKSTSAGTERASS